MPAEVSVGGAAGADTRREAHLSQRLPTYVQDRSTATAGSATWCAASTWAAWAQRNALKPRSLGASLAKPALNVGKGAVSLVMTLGTIAVLVLLLLLEGPKMRRGVLSRSGPGAMPGSRMRSTCR